MVLKLLKVARPQFLIGGIVIFLLGALWAVLLGSPFSLSRLFLGYLIILCTQLSVHFSNDYFDASTDKPGGTTLVSGGAGVLPEHPELRKPVFWIAVMLTLSSLGIGLVMTVIFSYPLWMIGSVALANFLGWAYSAPPLRLCARGLGEPCYAFISGFLAPSMGYFVMRGDLDQDGLFFIVPLTLYGLATMLAVEIPDVEDDLLADKRTWVARLGRGFAYPAITGLFLIATLYFFLFPVLSARQLPFDLRVMGLLSLLPLGVAVLGMIRRPLERGPSVGIATGIVLSMMLFGILVDSYLLYHVMR